MRMAADPNVYGTGVFCQIRLERSRVWFATNEIQIGSANRSTIFKPAVIPTINTPSQGPDATVVSFNM